MDTEIYTYDEAYEASLAYFSNDDLAATVFLKKYALKDNNGNILEKTPSDMHRRLAREFARIESKYSNPMSEDEIYGYLEGFGKIIPQGSPMAVIGNRYQIQSLSNCFVIPTPYDSYAGILKTDQEQAQLMKRRGGVGFDISAIRPKGINTANAARTTDGIGVFMERFSNTCREVAQGGRRGALMLTCDVRHPDIETFITIKRQLKKVTGANVSVKLTDEFMHAVQNDDNFQLQWPITSDNPTVTQTIKAKDLWDKIIDSAWAVGEPGVLFWDTVTKRTPADIYAEEGYTSVSTNPCGEICLSSYDSCRLLLLNVFSFVKKPFTTKAKFNWKEYEIIVQKAQRLMDNIVDLELEAINKIIKKISNDPEPKNVKAIELQLWQNIKKFTQGGRRTGLGITGLGDCLAALGVQYGNKKSVQITEKIYKNLALNAYRSSVQLAQDRGAFPAYSYEKEKDHEFINQIMNLDDELRENWKRYGRRNIALTTTAPAGSVSTQTQTTSGIEPAYMLEYTRRRKINPDDVDVTVDFVDELGDKWQEYTVKHHGYQLWQNISGQKTIEESPYNQSTTDSIDWINSVDIQAAAQKWICHSISKTCNFPKNTPKDVVAQAYMRAWKLGCKGFTVYREGCRSGVLISKADTGIRNGKLVDNHAPKRPESLDCNIHHATVKGENWTILIGLMNNKPYEMFGGLSSTIELAKKYKHGKILKHSRKTRRSIYDLVVGEHDGEFKIKDLVNVFDNPTHGAFTRTISLALRHGTPVQYVHEQLLKDEKDSDMFSFSRVMSRVLKHYVPDGAQASERICTQCNSEGLIYQEGCIRCKVCGWSKCS